MTKPVRKPNPLPPTPADVERLERSLREQVDAWALYQEPTVVAEVAKHHEPWIHAKPPGMKWRDRMREKIIQAMLPRKKVRP